MSREINFYKNALEEAIKKKPDLKKVFFLLEKSLKSGNPKAAYALWTWYFYGKHVKKNMKKAITLLHQAVKHNLPEALFDLAVSYEIGKGVRKNLRMALEYYMRASLYGDKEAVFEVGRCYYYGIGIRKDKRLSKIWLDRAKNLRVYKEEEIKGERRSGSYKDTRTKQGQKCQVLTGCCPNNSCKHYTFEL